MNNKNYNFRLAEEMVISTEQDLSEMFCKRSNQISKIYPDIKFEYYLLSMDGKFLNMKT